MTGIIDSMKWPPALDAGWREPVAAWLQTLSTWPWRDTARTLRQRFREDRLGLTASSLTFTTTIALVPLVTVMLAVFSAFPIFASVQGALERYFLQTLVPDTIARPVLLALTQFAAKANRLGLVGLVGLVITALALMLTIDRTLNNIWRVRRPRPIGQRVLIYWAAATLGPLLLGISLTFTSYALSASKGLVGALPGGVAVLVDALEFGLLVGAVSLLFRFVPNTPVRFRHALAGGLFVAVGFEVAKKLLAWYVRQVPTFASVYGAFATLPIFLVWIYLGWVVVLLGAVIAAYAPSLSMHLLRRASGAGYRFTLAVGILRELVAARRVSLRGLSSEQIALRLRTDPLQIDPLLDTLIAIDWVGRLDEAGAARYVLLCEPATTPAQPLLTQLLLDPGATLRGFWQRAGFGELTLQQLVEG
jgi:membrane protein